jgi:hypothetical protein
MDQSTKELQTQSLKRYLCSSPGTAGLSCRQRKNESLSGDIPADGTWRSDQTKEENQL